MNSVSIAAMTVPDYDAVLKLLQTMPGVVLRAADLMPNAGQYLSRHPANQVAAAFWARQGWLRREELIRYSLATTADGNA